MGRYKYHSSGRFWATELLVTFITGFLVATGIWLGLWFFQAKPAFADVLLTRENELDTCVAERELCTQKRDSLQLEKEEINQKLDEALIGWGRCIRSNPPAGSQGTEKETQTNR